MKYKIYFGLGILFLSCRNQHDQLHSIISTPKVVVANGRRIPRDSVPPPEIVPVGKPEIILAGKPGAVSIATNIHIAAAPKIVTVGTPKIFVPGEDSFPLPEIRQATGRPLPASMLEVKVVKEPASKDPNPQSFLSFTKLQGLKGDAVSCLAQDRTGNIWIGTWEGDVARYDGTNLTHLSTEQGLNDNNVL